VGSDCQQVPALAASSCAGREPTYAGRGDPTLEQTIPRHASTDCTPILTTISCAQSEDTVNSYHLA